MSNKYTCWNDEDKCSGRHDVTAPNAVAAAEAYAAAHVDWSMQSDPSVNVAVQVDDDALTVIFVRRFSEYVGRVNHARMRELAREAELEAEEAAEEAVGP